MLTMQLNIHSYGKPLSLYIVLLSQGCPQWRGSTVLLILYVSEVIFFVLFVSRAELNVWSDGSHPSRS